MGLRYCIRPATSVDVAFLAAVMDDNREPWSDGEDVVPMDRLLRTCACSAQIWAARDIDGTPTALWGVAPASDDPQIGQLWMLACEAFDNDPEELQGAVPPGVRRNARPVPAPRKPHRFAKGARHRASARHRLRRRTRPAAAGRPTATFTSCGSIPTDCIAAVAPACCPTDILFSFASVSQVWVTSFLRKKGRLRWPRIVVPLVLWRRYCRPAHSAFPSAWRRPTRRPPLRPRTTPRPRQPGNVAERLQSIRSSVSDAVEQYAKDGEPFVAVDRETQLAWWGNGGWRNGGWGNGGWHNWGNGGWHNWGNGWHNGWLNW